MSAKDNVKDLLLVFGSDLAKDLDVSLRKALKAGGGKDIQTPKLNFREKAYVKGNTIHMDVIPYRSDGESAKYWQWIESGRKKGARKLPADVVGKKWQNANGIDPRKVLVQLRLKKNPKLKISKKTLNYDKAARSLSFIIQRSIFNKGIKPKPFVDRVVNDGRINDLKADLKSLLGTEYKLEIILDGSNL